MLVNCPSCQNNFDIDLQILKAGTYENNCSSCGMPFVIEVTGASPKISWTFAGLPCPKCNDNSILESTGQNYYSCRPNSQHHFQNIRNGEIQETLSNGKGDKFIFKKFWVSVT